MNTKNLHKNFLLMVGAPTIAVEITEEQVGAAVNEANLTFKIYSPNYPHAASILKKIKGAWLEKYVYASLKETLGHIRGKFSGELPIPEKKLILRSNDLIDSGRQEKQDLLNVIRL